MSAINVSIPANGHDIPAILWGKPSEKLLIAVHGAMSNKADAVIAALAEIAIPKGWRVLSFDLPEHGDRIGEQYMLDPENAVADLHSVYCYAQTASQQIALFGCSIGAYLSLIAYPEMPLEQVLFLSPIVNMEAIIRAMMTAYSVDDARLEREQVIELPFPPPLSWSYLQQVLARPVQPTWKCPIDILYGTNDTTVGWTQVADFAKRYHAEVRVMENGEHYFHTEEQMNVFRDWVEWILE